jgi:hypothetical protein
MQQGTVTKKLVTAIAYMDTREIHNGVIDINGDGGFDGLMIAVKRYKPTTQPQYHHFVNENVLEVLEFDTITSGSGTATVVATVTTTGFARRGDTFLFSDGRVGMISSAITTASNKDSFTIKSVDGSNLTAVVGDKISPIGLVVGEKSDAVDALVYGQTKYFNQVQIFRDKTSMTDVQMKSTVEVGNGYYMYTQSGEQAKSFKLKLAAGLIAGKKSVNTFGTASSSLNDANGNSVQTTGGLYNEVDTYGIADAVATSGTVLMSDVDDLLDQILAVKGPSDYLTLSPDSAWRKYDDMLQNLNSSGVTSARLNMDGNEVDYNVTKYKKGKFTMEFGALPILDHPEIFNYSGASAIGKSIIGIPKDKVKTEGADGSSEISPRVGIRYIPNPKASLNQGTEYVQEFETGGLAKVPTSAEQVLDVHFLARQGMEVLGAKQMFRQRVLA